MTQEVKVPVKERKKLTITKVSDPQSIGTKGAVKLAFEGKDGDKVLPYFTFSNRLFPLIKIDEIIDVDMETSQHEYGGNIYTDRKITEIYVDGKPTGSRRQSAGSQFRQRSPEQNASIEAQSAYKGIIELLVAKIVKVSDPVGEVAIKWALSRLDGQGKVLEPEALPKLSSDALQLVETSEVKEQEDIIDSLATPEDITRLDVAMRRAKWDNMRFGKYAMNDKGWVIKSKKDLTKSQLEEAIKDILKEVK